MIHWLSFMCNYRQVSLFRLCIFNIEIGYYKIENYSASLPFPLWFFIVQYLLHMEPPTWRQHVLRSICCSAETHFMCTGFDICDRNCVCFSPACLFNPTACCFVDSGVNLGASLRPHYPPQGFRCSQTYHRKATPVSSYYFMLPQLPHLFACPTISPFFFPLSPFH